MPKDMRRNHCNHTSTVTEDGYVCCSNRATYELPADAGEASA